MVAQRKLMTHVLWMLIKTWSRYKRSSPFFQVTLTERMNTIQPPFNQLGIKNGIIQNRTHTNTHTNTTTK